KDQQCTTVHRDVEKEGRQRGQRRQHEPGRRGRWHYLRSRCRSEGSRKILHFPTFCRRQEIPGRTDDDNQVNDERTPIPPQTPKSKPKTTPSSTEPASPPFWPISPVPKRLHKSNPSNPTAPRMQRRATTNLTPSQPLPVREKPARRASAQVPESVKEVHSPTREQKQQRRVSVQNQGVLKKDGGRRVTGS
ncbi:unnamed protein product, partial [Aureobasidium pullulans]